MLGFFFGLDEHDLTGADAISAITKISGSLRLLTGLILQIGVASVGFYGRSWWIIWPFMLAYMISFIIGRWPRWADAVKRIDRAIS